MVAARGKHHIHKKSCHTAIAIHVWMDIYEHEVPQNDAYHTVLSSGASSGRAGMYQPFMTACRKPFFTRRSRSVRVKSPERTATAPRSCRALRASRDWASFSCGFATTPALSLAYCAACSLAFSALLPLAFVVVSLLAYSVERFMQNGKTSLPQCECLCVCEKKRAESVCTGARCGE